MLDEQTAEDRETCLLVSDNDGRLEGRRGAVRGGAFLYLVCLETLMLGFGGQCRDRDEEVLTASDGGGGGGTRGTSMPHCPSRSGG
jgi:hypothetical protein